MDLVLKPRRNVQGNDSLPWINRSQQIEVGHMSGQSNVLHYLRTRDLPDNEAAVQAVMDLAKVSSRLLTEEEILAAVRKAQA